jgi:hypothetical protein
LRAETQNAFATAIALASRVDYDKGHGRIEQRTVDVIPEVDRLDVFAEGLSRRRKVVAKNMAIVRHFAVNLIRAVNDKNGIGARLAGGQKLTDTH